jgi:hypothetical protein
MGIVMMVMVMGVNGACAVHVCMDQYSVIASGDFSWNGKTNSVA